MLRSASLLISSCTSGEAPASVSGTIGPLWRAECSSVEAFFTFKRQITYHSNNGDALLHQQKSVTTLELCRTSIFSTSASALVRHRELSQQ